jgi:NAD(P)-dependent dehydrogenase (short-subunit alcohol dehydrogenase family)
MLSLQVCPTFLSPVILSDEYHSGVIETPLFHKMAQDPETGKKYLASLPVPPARRYGQPEEIATAIAFLVGDDSSYIMGQVIPVGGGM